jgi:hypothetical protein
MSLPTSASSGLLWWIFWLAGVLVLVAASVAAARRPEGRLGKLASLLFPSLGQSRTRPAVSRWALLLILAFLVFVLVSDWLGF